MLKNHRQWLESFLQNARQSNRSWHTLINYQADLESFLSWFEKRHKRQITHIEAQDISDYSDYMMGLRPAIKARPWWKRLLFWQKKAQKQQDQQLQMEIRKQALAVASRKRHLSSIKNFFEFLKQGHEGLKGRQGKLFAHNPVKSKLHSVRLKDVDVVHTPMLFKKEWDILDLKTTKTRQRAMIYLLYFGGLRLIELRQLCWEDIDWDNQYLNLKRKGGDRHRLRPRSSQVLFNEIKRYARTQLPPEQTFSQEAQLQGPLFAGKSGRPLSERSLSAVIKRQLARCQLRSEISAHSFRKACATEMYLETRDLLAVRDFLNHADAKVTQTYIDKVALAHGQDQ